MEINLKEVELKHKLEQMIINDTEDNFLKSYKDSELELFKFLKLDVQPNYLVESKFNEKDFTDQVLVICLDGKGFSKIFKKILIKKPFDQRIHQAMLNGVNTVLRFLMNNGSNVLMADTRSDEVWIYIEKSDNETQLWPFFLRLKKLLTFAASSMTNGFNSIMQKFGLLNNLEICEWPVFDCNAWLQPKLIIPFTITARNMCEERNAIHNFGLQLFGKKNINGLSTREILEKIKNYGSPREEFYNFEKCLSEFLYGALIVKSFYNKKCENIKTKEITYRSKQRLYYISKKQTVESICNLLEKLDKKESFEHEEIFKTKLFS